MIQKAIAYSCAALPALAFVSCQKKTDVERCLDAQTSLVETLQKINDKDSADKYAGEADSLLEQFFTLCFAIKNTPGEKDLENNPQWHSLWDQLNKLGRRLQNQGYYGSEKLRAAFLKGRGK